MKNLLKDTLREIRLTFPRFLSIFAIICLGVAFFVGIKAAGPSMIETARQDFEAYHLMDGRVLSSQAINQADLEQLSSLEQVTIQPIKTVLAMLEPSGQPVKVFGYKETIKQQFELVEGHLPQSDGEIVLDVKYLELLNQEAEHPINLGDEISLDLNLEDSESLMESENKDSLFALKAIELKQKDYKVVGFVRTPIYFERINRGVDHAVFALIPEDQFLSNYYTEAWYWVAGVRGRAYEPRYQSRVDQVKEQMEDLLASRAETKWQASRADIDKEKVAIKEELEKASQDLQQARSNLLSKRTEFEEEEQTLQEGLLQVDQAEAGLLQQIQSLMNQAPQQALSLPPEQEQTLMAGQMESLKGQNEWIRGQYHLNASQSHLEEEVSLSSLEMRKASLGLDKLDRLSRELKEPTYYVFTREDDSVYRAVKENADKLNVIANLFPVFFFAIAVLVVFSTVKRMTSEQRTYMGTLKQMGYQDWKVIFKFVIYSGCAGILGVGLGILLGYQIFPPVILQAYNSMFYLDQPTILWSWKWNLMVALIALLCALIPATYTPLKLLRQAPAQLLRPEPPKQGKKILLENWTALWRRLSFNRKMTLRNLFRYKGRNLMTILGVAGCAMLITTGFGISDTISGLLETQFDHIQTYHATLYLKENLSSYELKQVLAFIEQEEEIKAYYPIQSRLLLLKDGHLKENVGLMVPMEGIDEFKQFIDLRFREHSLSLDQQTFDQQGPFYTERLGELFDIEKGQTVDFDADEESYSIPLKQPIENYIMHYVFMNPRDYQDYFGEKPQTTTLLLKYQDKVGITRLEERLLENEYIQSLVNISSIKTVADKTLASLDLITLVLILAAAGLAFVVLYNLTNINIEERNRELATIEVLGFYPVEVSLYVYEEILILTVIGSALGLGLGRLLTQVIMKQMQMNNLLFYPRIYLQSYLISFFLTLLFSTIVMIFMHGKIRRINMVEALKGID